MGHSLRYCGKRLYLILALVQRELLRSACEHDAIPSVLPCCRFYSAGAAREICFLCREHAMSSHHNCDTHLPDQSLTNELICHFPYAIFSVALGLIVLSFLTYSVTNILDSDNLTRQCYALFHSFHFLHLVFAATGTVLTFRRFSRNVFWAFVVGACVPSIFCMLSDVILPYIGGRLLQVPMRLHICFASELQNVLPFLSVGVLNGFVMSNHQASRLSAYSLGSHFLHILVSSLASLFYLVSHGFLEWQEHMGFVFIFLLIAVLVPCTLSDVVVPMLFAHFGRRR